MAYISPRLRDYVIERAQGYCEYCQTPKTIVIHMQIDHVVPESAGGSTKPDNLCLACINCNAHKSVFQDAFDSVTQTFVPLFNPRSQTWSDHFVWVAGNTKIQGITDIGRATVERLNMNEKRVVQARQKWVQAGWHPR